MTSGNSCSLIEARRSHCISPRNFHLYRRVANDIGPLLGLYQPLLKRCIRADIYVDRMIKYGNNLHQILETVNNSMQYVEYCIPSPSKSCLHCSIFYSTLTLNFDLLTPKSRQWPFRVTLRHRSRVHLIRHIPFLLVVHWNRAAISNLFRDVGLQQNRTITLTNEWTDQWTKLTRRSQHILAVVVTTKRY